MKIGYSRVSTISQLLDLHKALHEVGCEKIYMEKVSGVKAHRKEFEVMMEFGREIVFEQDIDTSSPARKFMFHMIATLLLEQ